MKSAGGDYSAELTSGVRNLFVSRSFSVGATGEEGMAHKEARSFRVDGASQSSAGAANDSGDDFDFPPTAHPGRELFTFSLFVLLITALVVWGSWKLISLI